MDQLQKFAWDLAAGGNVHGKFLYITSITPSHHFVQCLFCNVLLVVKIQKNALCKMVTGGVLYIICCMMFFNYALLLLYAVSLKIKTAYQMVVGFPMEIPAKGFPIKQNIDWPFVKPMELHCISPRCFTHG